MIEGEPLDVEVEKKQEVDENGEPIDDEEDLYDEEDYDAEGKYIWGKEGSEWNFYYKEDKDAHERGDPIHPSILNPP